MTKSARNTFVLSILRRMTHLWLELRLRFELPLSSGSDDRLADRSLCFPRLLSLRLPSRFGRQGHPHSVLSSVPPPSRCSKIHWPSAPLRVGGWRRNWALCLQRCASSVLLFRYWELPRFFAMWSFSVRQRSQFLWPLEYAGAWVMMDHSMFGSGPSSFSQMCVDKAVLCFWASFLNDAMCP